jgi:hypothetical protein
MIALAVVYMVLSLTVYLAMFVWLSKPRHRHPEMQEVKPGESLLTLKFHGSPSSLRPEQHPDLGFAEFLANRDSNFGDHGNS